jgi:glycosyltransferase involved in cell wall biosynthesis
MNVMLLTWEFPPKRIGNISDHVSTLAHELVIRGNDVEVIVLDDWKTGFEDVCGVHVHRFANPVRTHPMASVLSYTMTASVRMVGEAANVIYFYRSVGKKIDVVHAHDWLTVPSAILLKHAFNIPFVLTFHSIEKHRCHNNFSPLSIAIKEIEDLGIWESAQVIANSEWLRNEVLASYGGGHAHKIVAICPLQRNWVDNVVEIYGKVCNLKNSG